MKTCIERLDKLNIILQAIKTTSEVDLMMEFIKLPNKPYFCSNINLADCVMIGPGEETLAVVKKRIIDAHFRLIELLQQNLEKLEKP